MGKKRINETLIILMFFLGNFILWTLIFLSRNVWHQGYDDYYLHNMFAERLWSDPNFHITHPIYAIIVGGIAKMLSCHTKYVAVVVLDISQLMSMLTGGYLIAEVDDNQFKNAKVKYLMLSFCLNIIQPLIIPHYIISPSSSNGYISPTQILGKPFSLLCVIIFYRMYKSRVYCVKSQVVLLCMMVVSAYIKPVFLMAFVPSMGVLLLIDEFLTYKYTKTVSNILKQYILKVWPLLLAGCVLIIQYIQNINLVVPEDLSVGWGKNAPIRFGWMYAWKMVVPNVYINIFLAYALPIVVFLVWFFTRNTNEKVSDFAKMTLSYGLVSFFYISCLYQDGYAADLNFRNAWIFTFAMVYCICIVKLWKWNCVLYREHKENTGSIVNLWYVYVMDFLFATHMLFGVIMLVKNVIS